MQQFCNFALDPMGNALNPYCSDIELPLIPHELGVVSISRSEFQHLKLKPNTEEIAS